MIRPQETLFLEVTLFFGAQLGKRVVRQMGNRANDLSD